MQDKSSQRNIIEGNVSSNGKIHIREVYHDTMPRKGPEKPEYTKRVGLSVLSGAIGIGIGFLGELMPDNLKASFEEWISTNLGIEYWKFWLLIAFTFTITMLWLIWREAIGASQKKKTSTKDFEPEIRSWLLERYQNRLAQKMAGRLPINLRRIDFTADAAQIDNKQFKPVSPEDIESELTQFFKISEGRLLVVGTPGAGKTTFLLQLATGLLDKEPDALPVLINLSTWTKEFVTLDEWLKKILPVELGVNTTLYLNLLSESRIILLFDGLDEISDADERAACLAAIDLFVSTLSPRREFAISSRTEEFKTTKYIPMVSFAIEVGILAMYQIESELTRRNPAQPEDRDLLSTLQTDTLLRMAAETPFYFNCMQLMFGEGKRPVFLSTNQQDREHEVLSFFIENELRKCTEPQTKRWLAFLASRMSEQGLVRFELKDLQYSWSDWNKTQILFGKLVCGLVYGLGIGLLLSLIYGPFYALVISLLSLLTRDGFASGLLGGCVLGLFMSLSLALLYGSAAARGMQIETKDGARLSLEGLFRLGKKIIFPPHIPETKENMIPTLSFILSHTHEFITQYNHLLHFKSPYERFTKSIKFFHFSIIQHLLLRYQFSQNRLLPFQLVVFLNEMSNCTTKNCQYVNFPVHLMESDGISWRFRHRLIQDWFAKKWQEEFQK